MGERASQRQTVSFNGLLEESYLCNMSFCTVLVLLITVQLVSAKLQWFEQKLDHFNYENHDTWNQRYFVSDVYHRPGGPAFLSIGGEGPANPIWLEKGHWIEIAKDVGAMLFILEHRFYGESHPTPNTSVENLHYLSSEQALADLAKFITNITSTVGLKKWVTFGGSYSGSLSLWAKLKYPHLIQGAFSASAPLLAKMNFSEYNEVVNRSLIRDGSVECSESIMLATQTIRKMLKTDAGREQLQKSFNLCEPLNKEDDEYFQNTAADVVGETVQYNRDNRAFEGATGGNVTISVLCHHMTDKTLGNELERYASIPNLFGFQLAMKRVFSRRLRFNQNKKTSCMDASYKNFIDATKNETFDASRTWIFQTCTEFGWFQSTDSIKQPFRGFPADFFIDMCQRIFGLSFDETNIEGGISETNTIYGARNIAKDLTNAVLFNGGVDPWHAVSYIDPTVYYDEYSLTMDWKKKKYFRRQFDSKSSSFHTLFVASSAHCAVMYPDSPEDPPELVEARAQVSKYVKEWIQ